MVSGYAGSDATAAIIRPLPMESLNTPKSSKSLLTQQSLAMKIYSASSCRCTTLHAEPPRCRHRPTIPQCYFSVNDAQKRHCGGVPIDQLNQAKVYARPIVTTIETDATFYLTKKYHQDFAELNPNHPLHQRRLRTEAAKKPVSFIRA